jgi:hypothetical protein
MPLAPTRDELNEIAVKERPRFKRFAPAARTDVRQMPPIERITHSASLAGAMGN